MGEHLSPKYRPEIIAPPTITVLISKDFAIVIHTIPIVPTVPKDVPVIKDIAEHNKNANNIKYWGLIKSTAWYIICHDLPPDSVYYINGILTPTKKAVYCVEISIY